MFLHSRRARAILVRSRFAPASARSPPQKRLRRTLSAWSSNRFPCPTASASASSAVPTPRLRLFICSSSRLARALLGCGSRWDGHPSSWSRTQRCAAGFRVRPQRLRAQSDLLAGYRNAPGHLPARIKIPKEPEPGYPSYIRVVVGCE